MNCAWKELLAILPQSMKMEVDKQGRDTMQELRLRLGKTPELRTSGGSIWLSTPVTEEDIRFVVNTASRYSPWIAETAAQGYITAAGGHRIGLCGDAVVEQGRVKGISTVTGLCIRVARDFPGIAANVACWGNLLILGPPGSGKTTLLRDLCRRLSHKETVAVVDERGELFPRGFDTGKRLDVLSGCPKALGIDMALRTMGPDTVAVDEITSESDTAALQRAGWCGVRLIATAHAHSSQDLRRRSVYKPLVRSGIFDTLLILHPDKSWYMERMVEIA